MKVFKSIVTWSFVVFMLLMALGAMGQSIIAGILCLVSSALAAPITWKLVEKNRKKVRSFVKVLLSVGFFLVAMLFVPTVPEGEQQVSNDSISGESTVDISPQTSKRYIDDTYKDTLPEQIEETLHKNIISAIDDMEIHFIDVGQGASTLIKCGTQSMLIDAADNSKGTAIQNYLQKQGIEKLDYLILTHPDSDHIGGAPVIITKFDIDTVFMSDFKKDNDTYRKLIQSLDDKRLKWSTPEVGSTYPLGSGTITIIGPNQSYDDPNNASVSLLVQNGDYSAIFTGDAEEKAEEDILKSGINLDADIYFVGHHGSKTSSSEAFLDAISPTYAMISCLEGNSYGHPHAQTLNNLRARNIQVFRTDEQGSIIANLSENNIIWNAAPSETWQAGEPTIASTPKAPVAKEPEAKGPVAEAPEAKEPEAEAPAIEEPIAEAPVMEEPPTEEPVSNTLTYILNTKTKKFHKSGCSYLPTTNRSDSTLSREEVINNGYDPCKKCNP